MEEDVLVHVVEVGKFDTEGAGHATHVEPEGLEQLQEIHLFTCNIHLYNMWEYYL